MNVYVMCIGHMLCLECFDTVGRVTERAS